MKNRLDLHKIFQDILGSKNVYFQPPESIKMKYPAIRYSLDDIDKLSGDNIAYAKTNRYNVIVISDDPDYNIEIVHKILDLPLSSYDRHYVSNNLNHDSIKRRK